MFQAEISSQQLIEFCFSIGGVNEEPQKKKQTVLKRIYAHAKEAINM
jgi:hypothetical protein